MLSPQVLTYIMTWLPEWTLDFLAFLGVGIQSSVLYNMQIAARWIFFLSPVADPFIYALRHNKVGLRLTSSIRIVHMFRKPRGGGREFTNAYDWFFTLFYDKLVFGRVKGRNRGG